MDSYNPLHEWIVGITTIRTSDKLAKISSYRTPPSAGRDYGGGAEESWTRSKEETIR